MTRPLFDPGPATGNLSEDQAFVYDLLQANPAGMRTLDIGRALHIDGRYGCRTCNDQRTCEYAQPNAIRVLRQLGTPTEANPRGRGLVIHRKTGLWQSLRPVPRPDDTPIPY